MNEVQTGAKKSRLLSITEVAIIILLASVPLFVTFPYRVNIFLSWEGAYRLSEGQIPYKDFGMPLGYMYWVIPAIFFKIFGAQLITLVKAQVFINILSGLAFRSTIKNLGVQPGIRFLAILVYCVSFSFFNFWPWYNHTVIVYQVIGLACLFTYLNREPGPLRWLWLSFSAFFTFCSFFTKQDGGALAFLLCLALLAYHAVVKKDWKSLFIYAGSVAVVAFAVIAPLLRFNFAYWFNLGQAPHTARVSLPEIIDEFLIASSWIKFYLLLIVILSVAVYRRSGRPTYNQTLFLLLTLGILAEAAILQVTSYTPPDNNIFFHSFAFAFILSQLSLLTGLNFTATRLLLLSTAMVLLWWSSVFWKYIQRTMYRFAPAGAQATASGENVVNRKTYVIGSQANTTDNEEWVFSNLNAFRKIAMPRSTADGLGRLMKDPVANQENAKVLNLTELTPLAVELPYRTETGPDIPLWHHLGVGLFNKHAQQYEEKIRDKYYDVVLFEHIPSLNNFFPFRIRDSLRIHYKLIDSFPAPRRGETQGMIELYHK